ncbi:MAG: hypothetical protein U0871_00220 [Gemmataceae bacterium]
MTRSPRRRPGLSLTEVLVALFVMALGLIALLTLFPLGAMQVAQALKDDRTAQLASQADAYIRQYWRTQVVAVPEANRDSFIWALDDPNLLARKPDQPATPRSPVPGMFEAYFAGAYNIPAASVRRQLPVGAVILNRSSPTPLRASSVSLIGDLFPDPTSGLGTAEVDTAVRPDCWPPAPQPLVATATTAYATSGYVRGDTTRQDVPSYPILLDAVGYLGRTAVAERLWVAGGAGNNKDLEGMVPGSPQRETIFGVRQFATNPPPGGFQAGTDLIGTLIPRRKLDAFNANLAGSTALNSALAVFGLTDDLSFQPNGAPNPSLLGRQGRYTWAAMLQRPNNNKATTAKFWVLVFDGRPSSAIPTREEVVLANTFVNSGSGVGQGTASLTLAVPSRGPDQSPLVRRGGWVMLANINPNPASKERAVSFHRVVGLAEGDATQMPVYFGATGPQVDVVPYQLDLDPPVPQETAGANTQVYLFGGLSEVFARPDLTPDPGN